MTPDREAAIRALAECTVQRLGSFNPHTLDAETLNGLEHAKSVLTLSDALDEARRELAESRQEPEAGIAAHMATMAQCDDLAAERDSLTAELAVKDEALRELIGACAVPLEALRMTEAYKPMLSPSMVETIIAATEVLRRHTAALASPEQEPEL